MENYFEVKFSICDLLKQPLSEVENLPFYEVELLVEWLEKKEKKRRESESGDKPGTMQNPDAKSMMREAQRSMPKITMPKMPRM